MNKELIIRAKSMALSYVLEHLIAQGILPVESWKEYADKFFDYITEGINLLENPENETKRSIDIDSFTDVQKKLLFALRELGVEKAPEALRKLTSFKDFGGYYSLKRVSDKVAEIAIGNLVKIKDKCPRNDTQCENSEYDNSGKAFCKIINKECLFSK